MNSRWIKPAGPTYAPVHLVTVCVRGQPAADTTGRRLAEEVWDSAAVCVSRYRYGMWGRVETFHPASGAELIDFVHSIAKPRTGTCVVCPVAQYALTLSGMWRRWEEEGVKWNKRGGSVPEGTTPAPPIRQSADPVTPQTLSGQGSPGSASAIPIVSTCILRGNPDIVRYTIDRQQFTWASGHNWYPCTEEALAKTVGFPWSNPGERWHGKHPPRRSPTDRAMLWHRAMHRITDWWREIDGGPWGWTVGGLAMSYFRKRLEPKSVLSHQVDAAREVEERGLFGGRAQTYCLAPFGPSGTRAATGHAPPPAAPYPRQSGPLEHWDVASMYPTILATQQFPTRIWYVNNRPPVGKVASDLKHCGSFADVLIDTDSADYPCRDEERVIWPIGRFRTVLCGPELQRAIDRGHVKEVFRSVSYTMGKPFAAAAGSLILLRQRAKTVGDPAWEMLVKSLSNAFGGKLAQIRFDWLAAPRVTPLVSWGEWEETPRATGQPTIYRAAAGLAWQKCEHKHKGRPLASCFGYLTSYGRELLFQLKQLVPAEQLVSVDTDGLWVCRPSPALWTKVRRRAAALGYTLRRTAVSEAGQWYGPRHYWTTGGWILSGYHEPRRLGRDLTFRDSQTTIPPATLKEGAPKRVRVTYRTTKLTLLATDGRVGPDGWVTPRRLQLASPLPLQSDRSTVPDAPVPAE